MTARDFVSMKFPRIVIDLRAALHCIRYSSYVDNNLNQTAGTNLQVNVCRPNSRCALWRVSPDLRASELQCDDVRLTLG